MRLRSAEVIPSPLGGGRARLVGEVVYDDQPGRAETYWFDVPADDAPNLSRTGNPWLVCLAPLASTLGEPLEISLPVDRLLYRNVREAIAIWRSWYPRLHAVEVRAETEDGLPRSAGSRTASTFSGGVDSFFTAVRSAEAGALPVHDLVTVAGFDISFANFDAFERRRDRLAVAAERLGKSLVDVIANLRTTRLEKTGWGELWHGAGLASVGLALEGRFSRLMIASTYPYPELHPLGSHPMVDPLFSTSRTEVLHDGASLGRVDKLEYLCRSDVALENLHVCFRNASDYNCGSCEKCLRTMAVLEVLGVLPVARTFPIRRLEPGRLARSFVKTETSEAYYRAIERLAAARGRRDIVRSVRRALRRSRRRRRLLPVAEWLGGRRGLWRASRPFRRLLLAGEYV